MRCDICNSETKVTSDYNEEQKRFDSLCEVCKTIIKDSLEEYTLNETSNDADTDTTSVFSILNTDEDDPYQV